MNLWEIALLVISFGIAMSIDQYISKEKYSVKKFLVDTILFSGLSFFVMMFVETYIFELTVTQSLDKRFKITIFNFLTARVYGIFRDKMIIRYLMKPTWVIDGCIYIVYHGIPYIGIVSFDSNIPLNQKITIALATISGTFIIGIFYGKILEYARFWVIKSP